jgi:putative drug exporter of the RND superfamily
VFAAIGRFAVRFRYFVVAFWVIVTVLCVHFLPSLSSVTQNENSAFLPNSAPSVAAANLASPFQKSNLASGLIVAAVDSGTLTPADNAAISRIEAAVRHVEYVQAVQDHGISGDGAARDALVETSTGGFDITQSEQVVDQVRALFTNLPPGLQVHFTGQIATSVDENRSASHQQGTTEKLSLLFIVLLLLIVFRGVLAPFVTLLPAFLAFTIAGPVVAEAARAGVEVSGFTQFMLIVLMLGAGTDYGLFLIFRYREEMARGREPRPAVVEALTKVGQSITFSGSTVILAFLSLLLASFGLYRGLGPGLAIGIAIVLVVDLTLLPALLTILGKSVFWPRAPQPGSYKEGLWGKIAGRVIARPAITLVAGIIVFGGLAFANLSYSPSGFGSTSGPPATSDSAIGLVVLDKHFPIADANPTNVLFKLKSSVWDDPSVLVVATDKLEHSPVFSAVSGPLDPNGHKFPLADLVALHGALAGYGPAAKLPLDPPAGLPIPAKAYQAYRATAQFISPDGKTLQIYTALTAGDPSSNKAMEEIPQIRAAVAKVATAIDATDNGVAGEAAAIFDVSTISGQDLVKIIPVVLVVILLLLILLLRSLIAPLYLIVSVGLSYLAALGLAVLIYVIIAGDSGINFILPFFMFLFLMALGSDYNILVMSRIREEAHDAPLAQAVRTAVGTTGTTVTSAGLILAGTFLVLTVATSGSIRQVGIGLAIGILLDTFLVRTLFVPSVVVLLGKWNWWPSHLYHSHDDRHGKAPGGDRTNESLGSAGASGLAGSVLERSITTPS